eukprot:1322735-Prymnesium_polylepis.1
MPARASNKNPSRARCSGRLAPMLAPHRARSAAGRPGRCARHSALWSMMGPASFGLLPAASARGCSALLRARRARTPVSLCTDSSSGGRLAIGL